MKAAAQSEAAAALESAIERAKEVAADIQQAADNLAVVNTVLQTNLADHLRVGEVAQALDHSGEVEKTLVKSVKALEEVNAALESGTSLVGS